MLNQEDQDFLESTTHSQSQAKEFLKIESSKSLRDQSREEYLRNNPRNKVRYDEFKSTHNKFLCINKEMCKQTECVKQEKKWKDPKSHEPAPTVNKSINRQSLMMF